LDADGPVAVVDGNSILGFITPRDVLLLVGGGSHG